MITRKLDLSQLIAIVLVLVMTVCGVGELKAQTLPVTSNLRLWLDATDINANGQVWPDGTSMVQWVDKSGNGNTLQKTAGTITYTQTGMNGLESVYMPTGSTFAGPNIFPGSTAPETTIFIVNSRVATLSNFALNLNGITGTGVSGANARFSLHMPWSNDIIYFDAGACCSTTRIARVFPIGVNQANLVTAGNSINGFGGQGTIKQFLRVDASAFASDSSAIAPTVANGLHLGSTTSYPWDGHFSEILIYDRALSLTEIEQVECYLSDRWALNFAGCGSPVVLSVGKSSAMFGAAGQTHNTPGSELIYSIDVTHTGGTQFDPGSFFMVDRLPDNLEFFNGDLDGASGPFTDPVGFTNSGSALTWNYGSNVSFASGASPPTAPAQCSYVPSAGYDPNVKFICIAPGGSLTSGTASFKFRARIK